jgi:hypothetical protein
MFGRAKTTDHSIGHQPSQKAPSATHFFAILHFLYNIGTFDHFVHF